MSSTAEELELLLPGGRRVSIPAERPLVVGSAPGAEGLQLAAPGVAERHLALARLKDGGFGLKVLEGEGQTTLDGRPVRQARLAAGQRLGVGGLELAVVSAEAAGAKAAASPAALAVPTPRPAEAESAVRVAGFRIVRPLGKGGMGHVYLAVQESLEREVALKLLRPELGANADFVRRFQGEARAAATLNHPNVVTVYDVGEDRGQHYLALEYMDRGSLEDRVRREGPLPWRAVLGVLRDAAAGLEFAAQRGIVHRDIKPANLMQSAAGTTKIVDLGLATAVEAEGVQDDDGKIRGTPHFMSPEQARGAPVDARSDLYSLGASAYRLLTGRTPFEGDSTRAILRAVVQEPPKAVRETVAEVPAEVDALLAELLAKDPAARPPTATALRARVEELFLRLGGAGLATAGGGRGGAKWAVGLLLLGAAGGAVWWFGTDRSAPPTDGGNPALETSEPEPETVLRPANDPGAAVAAEENDVAPSLGAEEARLQAVEREAERALRATESVADDAEREAALRELATTFGGTTAATEALERAEALALARAAANAAAGTAPVPTSAELVRQGAQAATRDAAGALLPPEIAHDQLARWPLPIGVAPGPEVAAVLEELVRELDAELRAASDARLAEADQQLLAGEFDAAEEGYEALHAWLRELPERLRAERAAAEAAHRASLEAPVDPAAPPVVVPPPPEPVYRLAERVALVESRLDRLDDWRELHAEALRQRDLKTLAAALPGGPFEQSLRRFDFDGALAALRAVYQQLQSPRYRQALEQRTVDLQGAADCFRWLEESFAAGGWRRSNVPIPGERRGVGEARAVQASGLVAVVDGAPRDVAWAEFATEVDALVQLFDGRLTRELEPAERAGLAHLLCAAAWNLTLARVDPIFDPGRRGRLTENEAEQIQKAFGRAREMAAAAGTNDLERIASEQLAAEHLCLALRAVERGDPATAAFGFEQLLDAAPTAQLTLLLSDGRPAGLPASWPPELPGVDELPTPAAGEPR